jgi:DNA-binding transcriptional regulator YhcF (GntR family)
MPSPPERKTHPKSLPQIPAEAALSFLKDTKGALTWTTRDLANALKVDRPEAQQALAFLQAQGYVQPAHQGGTARRGEPARTANEWMTTPAGEAVSGAKTPRFTRESVDEALKALKDRIQQNNKNRQSPYRITDAIAFGDFLLPDRARVQSADVGIRLARRENSGRDKNPASEPRSATEAKAERKFLSDLRSKSAHLNLRPYADWMRRRSHSDLL